MVVSDDLVIKFEAEVGTAIPAATAVAAIAFAFIKSRLVNVIPLSPDVAVTHNHYDEKSMMMRPRPVNYSYLLWC